MSQDTVYISATETGLVKWDEFRKPPYSAQDYLDAYNNGQRMTAAFNQANANGASKVVLERGNYPICYVNNLKGVAKIPKNNAIEDTLDFKIDGNGSCLFVIFDSVNRSPYHTGEAASLEAPHQLSGCVFWLESNTNLEIYGFNLRGDQYMRSWVTGEQNNEQTYGVLLSKNNYNTKIDIVAHGFRGDGISRMEPFQSIQSLTGGYQNGDWLKGGVNSLGVDEPEAGAYRTLMIDLRETVIYRNAVQLSTFGNLGHPRFRSNMLAAFFYKADGTFISKEFVWCYEPIYLPKDYAFIKLVAYKDERTDDKVTYGSYLYLTTGCSNYCEVRGEFYANHRGAVSNLCDNTIVDADIHDNGTTKYGFPHYWSTTRYGVNFEDVITGKLTVRGTIKNGGTAIMCNSSNLIVKDCIIKNMLYAGVVTSATRNATITGCTFDNVPDVFGTNTLPSADKRTVIFSENTLRNCGLWGNYRDTDNVLIDINRITLHDSNMDLRGNGKNLIVSNVVNTSVKTLGSNRAFRVHGALKTTGNIATINADTDAENNRYLQIDGDISYGNKIINDSNKSLRLGEAVINTDINHSGTQYVLSRNNNLLPILRKSTTLENGIHKINITDCSFDRGILTIGDYSNVDLCDSITHFKDTQFHQSIESLNHFIDLSCKGGTDATVKHELIFTNCTFNMGSNVKHIFNIVAGKIGVIKILFIKCTFISDTPQITPFKVIKGKNPSVGDTARALGCKFINISP